MTPLAWLLTVSVAICAGALAMTLVNLRLYRRPEPAGDLAGAEPDGSGPGPLVAVCVPARNEEANIEACVRSLLAQTHRRVEVLVYNDQSTDGTGEILARLAAEDVRVRPVPAQELPDGWNGKQFGCDRMGRFSQAPWLLFTDADVRFEPGCLRLALRSAGALNADLVSTFPRQLTGSLAEALAAPMIHFILFSYLPMGRMRATGDPAASAGCGQFLLVRREAWLAAGGHASFRSSMHDGIRLPRALRRAGFRTDLFDGTDLCRVRMYSGLAQVWRGFTKNAYEGLGSIPLLVFITLLHLAGHLLPWLVLLAWLLGQLGSVSPAGPQALTGVEAGLAAAGVALALVQRFVLAARFRQNLLIPLLHPAAIVLLAAIQWWSLVLHLTGRRSWRGRRGLPEVGRVPTSAPPQAS